MRNTDYYVPALALGIAFIAKLPGLVRGWRSPMVRSVCSLVFTACLCFLFAAPPTITAVNEATGVTNFSGPLVYCIMGAFDCACLVLIVNWRGGPEDRVHRSSRRWIIAYTLATIALPVLFVFGDTPVERLRDLDTYYANTPFIREMIIIYLAAHLISAIVTTALCVRWAREVGEWLRIGLMVLIAGFILNVLFGATKMTAVVARWAGHDWDALSTDVAPPMAATGALIVTTGFIVPLVGPRLSNFLRSVTAYIHLLPLWRQLRSAPGEHAPLPGTPRFASLQLRLTVRETVLNDELLRLQPFLDDHVRERAHATADEGHADPDDAEMIGLAAMVAAAIDKKATSPEPVPAPTADPPERSPGAAALTDAVSPGRERLVALSRALRSPIVAAARRGLAVSPAKAPTAP